jgi:hypothetical protein
MNGGKAVKIFLAHLRSIPHWCGPDTDLANAATAAWRTLLPLLTKTADLEIEWFVRHGDYSTYDPGWPETFERVTLDAMPDNRWGDRGLKSFHLLTDAEVQQVRSQTNVADVEADLARLSEGNSPPDRQNHR